jgi:DMATS type aromatic prenyltransferase
MRLIQTARLHTLLDLGLERLLALGHALDLGEHEIRTGLEVFQVLASGWAAASLRRGPRFASDITDDHTPFEFSLAIDHGTPELRFLSEAQGDEPSLSSNWEAARQLNRSLAAEFGVDLHRLSIVEELFAPTAACPRFALWHAVCLRPHGPPDFKVYLNPQARGAAHAPAIVEEAMRRLGLGDAWAQLPERGPDDEICYFSLDLAARPEARVKIYVAHRGASLERIERAVSTAHGFVPGRAAEFCQTMAEGPGPYFARPVLTCVSFVEGHVRPRAATVHFPVRAYVANDAEVHQRTLGAMSRASAQIYARALDAFPRRALVDRSGLQTYVSRRLDGECERFTVYLAPEAYAVPVQQSLRPSRPSLATTLLQPLS